MSGPLARLCEKTSTLITLIYTDQKSSVVILINKSVSSVFICGEICFLCKAFWHGQNTSQRLSQSHLQPPAAIPERGFQGLAACDQHWMCR